MKAVRFHDTGGKALASGGASAATRAGSRGPSTARRPQDDRQGRAATVERRQIARRPTQFEASIILAKTIVRAAQEKNPRLRYPSGKADRQGAFARRLSTWIALRQDSAQAVRLGVASQRDSHHEGT
jgi:hypothetical protein